MVDEETAPEVGDSTPDPSMEVAAGDNPAADVEVGTVPPAPPEVDDETPADENADEEAEEADEITPAEAQANFEPPPPLDQASHVQGLMVAGSKAGQDQRRETIARNRERRRLQQEAIKLSNQG